jgi:multiple sugar transport system permease protein
MQHVRRALRSDHVAGWGFVLPSVLLIVLFGLVPIVWGFLLSLQRGSLIGTREWAGLSNYTELIPRDPYLAKTAANTAIYTLLFVPISIVLAMFVAVALNQRIRLIRFYRLAVFIPVVTSTIATGIMFLWVFDKTFGIANWALGGVGLGPFGFFESTSGALPSIVVMTIWGWLGFDTIIFLAALQGVPHELVEAAAIDGAGRWSAFRNVTLPMLGPATLLLVVWSTISALQLFDEVYFVTRGGPLNSTLVIVLHIFNLAFTKGIAGYAAALAYLLFLVILVFTLLQYWLGNKVVHYSS